MKKLKLNQWWGHADNLGGRIAPGEYDLDNPLVAPYAQHLIDEGVASVVDVESPADEQFNFEAAPDAVEVEEVAPVESVEPKHKGKGKK